jgi:hypothetical protein
MQALGHPACQCRHAQFRSSSRQARIAARATAIDKEDKEVCGTLTALPPDMSPAGGVTRMRQHSSSWIPPRGVLRCAIHLPQAVCDMMPCFPPPAAAAAMCLQNLMQFPDRHKWYAAKFAADDMPDWNPGRFVSIDQAAPGGCCSSSSCWT